jgi:hypothetical protein
MKLIFLTFGLLLISLSLAIGQCPPSTTCTATWTTVEHDLDELLDEDGFRASVTFSYRVNCDGDFEFIVDDILIKENSQHLDEFQYLHYSYSSITEKVVLDYMLTSNALGNSPYGVPAWPNTIKRIFVYTAKCGIWLRCSYKLPEEIVYVCDDPWGGSPPDYASMSGRWVDHWRWHSCGVVCCKKVYELSVKSGYIQIVGKTKGRYPEDEECSLEDTFFGKRPTPDDGAVALPCEDGC